MLLAQCLVSGGCSVNKSFWRLLDFPWDSEIQVSRESVTNVSYTLNPGSLWGGGGRLFPPLPFGFLATWVAQKWIQWKLSSAVCYMWQFVSCPRTQCHKGGVICISEVIDISPCPLSPSPHPLSSHRADHRGAVCGWCQRHLHEGRGHQLRIHRLLREWKGLAFVTFALWYRLSLLLPLKKWEFWNGGFEAMRDAQTSFRRAWELDETVCKMWRVF